MAEEELQVGHLKDEFYKDGFYKALSALGVFLAAIFLLVSLFLYLVLTKPSPIRFIVSDDFRVLAEVPNNQSYISDPDLIQWVSQTLPAVFKLDFVNYAQQLSGFTHFFTDAGWNSFMLQLNTYANSQSVLKSKLFVSATPAGAPIILNKGLLKNNVYAWEIQMPLNLSYSSGQQGTPSPIVASLIVVRVSNLNNMAGVAIDSITVKAGTGEQVTPNA